MRIGTGESSEVGCGSLHNISVGGVGFWIDQPVENGASVSFRIPTTATWSEVEVVHCTPGLGRYLIGARRKDEVPWGEDESCSDCDAPSSEAAHRPSPFDR